MKSVDFKKILCYNYLKGIEIIAYTRFFRRLVCIPITANAVTGLIRALTTYGAKRS